MAISDTEGPDEAAYLHALGERVRQARARRGMTRRQLSAHSGVSERYLAQLEGGQGNVSIVLLRAIAHAIGLPLAELVAEGPERPVDLTLLDQFLSRLTPEQLVQARRALEREFGRTKKSPHGLVALIGLRGAGKTTLGQRMAEKLGIPFLELNREIERESGISLSEIFDLYGQGAYRRYERRALERIVQTEGRAIVTTGGSLVSEAATFELLLSACFTVWVKAEPEAHMGRVMAQGDLRPMANNPEAMADLRRILQGREPLYAKADAVLDTTGKTVDQCIAELAGLLA